MVIIFCLQQEEVLSCFRKYNKVVQSNYLLWVADWVIVLFACPERRRITWDTTPPDGNDNVKPSLNYRPDNWSQLIRVMRKDDIPGGEWDYSPNEPGIPIVTVPLEIKAVPVMIKK